VLSLTTGHMYKKAQKYKGLLRTRYRAAALYRRLCKYFQNQVEIWYKLLTGDAVRGGVWSSNEDLGYQIMFCVRRRNRE
jgi:hypothetical protein